MQRARLYAFCKVLGLPLRIASCILTRPDTVGQQSIQGVRPGTVDHAGLQLHHARAFFPSRALDLAPWTRALDLAPCTPPNHLAGQIIKKNKQTTKIVNVVALFYASITQGTSRAVTRRPALHVLSKCLSQRTIGLFVLYTNRQMVAKVTQC